MALKIITGQVARGNSLEYNGYINKQSADKSLMFNSPILKMWWCENVANY